MKEENTLKAANSTLASTGAETGDTAERNRAADRNHTPHPYPLDIDDFKPGKYPEPWDDPAPEPWDAPNIWVDPDSPVD